MLAGSDRVLFGAANYDEYQPYDRLDVDLDLVPAGDRIELAAKLQRLHLATGQAIRDDGERGISASPGNLAAFEEEAAARPVWWQCGEHERRGRCLLRLERGIRAPHAGPDPSRMHCVHENAVRADR